ncbi:MAG: hypothetical protein PHC85_00955 [Candidatus Pacebacteria bacterium]|nr:hypothetical protein [Candidatus Paceibacterota bacterium]
MGKNKKKRPKKTKLEMIFEKTAEDVRILRKNASIVINIENNAEKPVLVENPNGRLNLIAVIGPSSFLWEGKEYCVDEAVLLEIGAERARPYILSKAKRGKLKTKSLHGRNKRFFLSESQYKIAAPVLFDCIAKKATEKCSTRMRAGWKIHEKNTRWNKFRKNFEIKDKTKWRPNGSRFSVSKKDSLVLGDIFWAELNLNSATKRQVDGIANAIGMVIVGWTEKRGKDFKKFLKSQNGDEIKWSIKRLPLYLEKIAMKRCIEINPKSRFVCDFCELLGINLESKTDEEILAEKAEEIGNPLGRIGNMVLKTSPRIAAKRKTQPRYPKRYVVIEVYPPEILEKEEEETNWINPKYLDQTAFIEDIIPF